jgi:trehalose 6-phosphate phosphatase
VDILNSETSYQSFFKNLKTSQSSLLMLDYDGTLSPFVPDRDKAAPYDGVRERLSRIIKTGGSSVVIVSGRTVAVLQSLLKLECEIEYWGNHGAERQLPGQPVELTISNENLTEALFEVDSWAAANGLQSNLETKPVSRAFHWRGENRARVDEITQKVKAAWVSKAVEHDLVLHEFDGGLELRPAGISKAMAVRTLLAEAASETVAAYLGDDMTDEDAFEQLGKRGLKVLVREKMRPTKADWRLTPPFELLKFLDDWHLAVFNRQNSSC